MALVPALTMTVGGGAAELSIIYNDANNKIQSVDWSLAAGHVARIVIWDNDIDPNNPIYDQTYGQGSGAQSIPGNYYMVEVTEYGDTFLDLPPNIRFNINVETIG
jgi:hypothetical protein